MDRTVTIDLISYTTTYDEILQPVKTESSRTVYAQMRSITRAEWFEAGRNGLKPDFCFVMQKLDYQGEEVLAFNGIKYGIYRTYLARGNMIELYCEKKGGV